MKEKKNIPKKEGFTSPDGYFLSSKECILATISLEKEIAQPSTSGFEVPQDYFKESKAGILHKLSRKRATVKETSTLKKLTPYLSIGLGIAASLLLFVSILTTNSKPEEVNLDDTLVAHYFETDGDLEDIQFEEWLSLEDIESLEGELSFEETATLDYLQNRTTTFDLYTD